MAGQEINTSEERLKEMQDIKAANAQILSEIDIKTAALKNVAAKFEQERKIALDDITSKRELLARESNNHSKLDTVVMQKQIDDLTSQLSALTETNKDLTSQLSALKKV